MGYGKKQDPETNRTIDLDLTFNEIVKPAATQCGFECIRGDEILESGMIDRSMYGLLYAADLVIADISTYNPNALYELGIRHALKKFSTIIIKENQGKLPFDINHNKTFCYQHLGTSIDAGEITRSINGLKTLIKSVSDNEATDSPLYSYIPEITQPDISDDILKEIISNLQTKERTISSLTNKAQSLKDDGKFKESSKIWEELSSLVSNDAFYIQQYAICTYKSKTPNEELALHSALKILLTISNYDDSETLGIHGAIYKRLWMLDRNKNDYLTNAINYYKRGWEMHYDHYTGGNYAECLQHEAVTVSDSDDKVYYRVRIQKLRQEIIEYITTTWDNKDNKWKYATLANCYLGLGDNKKFEKYSSNFQKENPAEREIESFEQSQSIIKDYLEKIKMPCP